MEGAPRVHSLGDRGGCATGAYRTPTTLDSATKTERAIAALPNTQKQTQGGCQNKGTKKHGLNERMEKNSRKRTEENGDKKSIRCRVQNTGYKDAERTQLDLTCIKQIQSEMKDALIEIKNNLQGNNSRVTEADNQINNLENKETKTATGVILVVDLQAEGPSFVCCDSAIKIEQK